MGFGGEPGTAIHEREALDSGKGIRIGRRAKGFGFSDYSLLPYAQIPQT
jgi:hypothetical protein